MDNWNHISIKPFPSDGSRFLAARECIYGRSMHPFFYKVLYVDNGFLVDQNGMYESVSKGGYTYWISIEPPKQVIR